MLVVSVLIRQTGNGCVCVCLVRIYAMRARTIRSGAWYFLKAETVVLEEDTTAFSEFDVGLRSGRPNNPSPYRGHS